MPQEDPNAELSRAEYWEKRYSDNAPSYDWLRSFDTVKPFLTKHLPAPETNPRILHAGNGNSVSLTSGGVVRDTFLLAQKVLRGEDQRIKRRIEEKLGLHDGNIGLV